MNIVDIIVNADIGERFRMSEPAIGEESDAYKKWLGLTVEKVLGGAIIVVDKSGVKQYAEGDFLNLSGLVVDSEWEKVVG